MSKKFAVLGGSVQNSLSPKIYNFIAEKCGQDISYEALSIPTPAELASIIRGAAYEGLNITMPYKKEVLSYVCSMTEEVKALSSANTLIREADSYRAYSTDGPGFVSSLVYHNVKIEGASVYLYGLGGASRPIAYSLIKAGCSKLYYESRTEASEVEFKSLLTEVPGSDIPIHAARSKSSLSCDIAINASSFGTRAEERPSIDLNRIQAEVYYDIIYVRETELLKQAKERGKIAIGGIDMLIAQALFAFGLFYPELNLPEGLFPELKTYLEG